MLEELYKPNLPRNLKHKAQQPCYKYFKCYSIKPCLAKLTPYVCMQASSKKCMHSSCTRQTNAHYTMGFGQCMHSIQQQKGRTLKQDASWSHVCSPFQQIRGTLCIRTCMHSNYYGPLFCVCKVRVRHTLTYKNYVPGIEVPQENSSVQSNSLNTNLTSFCSDMTVRHTTLGIFSAACRKVVPALLANV